MLRLWHLRRLGETLGAHARLHLLRAGIRLGLFEALREERRADELAERLGLARDLVDAWLRALHAQGLLRRRGEAYRLGGFARWLIDAPDAKPLHALLEHAAASTEPRLAELPELLKGAERPRFGTPGEAERVAAVSRLLEPRALAALRRIPSAGRARRVLDVGCGHGSYLARLLQRRRDAQGLGIELDPQLAEQARVRLREAGVARRGEIRVGDFLTMELPGGRFELALLNHGVHYFAPAERPALFRRVRERLVEGGVFAIQTPVIAAGLVARLTGSAASAALLDLFLRCHRNLHGLPDPGELEAALGQAGFAETGRIRVWPGGAALYVWGRLPGRRAALSPTAGP